MPQRRKANSHTCRACGNGVPVTQRQRAPRKAALPASGPLRVDLPFDEAIARALRVNTSNMPRSTDAKAGRRKKARKTGLGLAPSSHGRTRE
jgi:hypothetical protein